MSRCNKQAQVAREGTYYTNQPNISKFLPEDTKQPYSGHENGQSDSQLLLYNYHIFLPPLIPGVANGCAGENMANSLQ